MVDPEPSLDTIVERPWLASAIEGWWGGGRDGAARGGQPGVGKTVALAGLARRRDVLAAHFCRARDDRLINPLRLVRELSDWRSRTPVRRSALS